MNTKQHNNTQNAKNEFIKFVVNDTNYMYVKNNTHHQLFVIGHKVLSRFPVWKLRKCRIFCNVLPRDASHFLRPFYLVLHTVKVSYNGDSLDFYVFFLFSFNSFFEKSYLNVSEYIFNFRRTLNLYVFRSNYRCEVS